MKAPLNDEARGALTSVIAALAKTLKVQRNSLCFCGSARKFKQCCGSCNNDKPIFLGNALDIANNYAISQGREVTGIPTGIWNRFETASLNRFLCLYPGCTNKPVNCHLIPENILRSSFGGHCKEFRLVGKQPEFGKVGITNAGCLPVFCSHHDDSLFRRIDSLTMDHISKEQEFLIGLKAIAFSLRKIQYLIGIDSQIEIFRPFILKDVNNNRHMVISIDHLHEQYIRFIAQYNLFEECISAHKAIQLDFFSSAYRDIPYNGLVFASTLTTIPYDLKGQKINKTGDAIAIACSIFTIDKFLRVVFSCPRGISSTSYLPFLRQLAEVNDGEFITILNNVLTFGPDSALMPESFSPSEDDLRKIIAAGQLAGQSLKPGGSVFDLKNTIQAVRFI
jgi:SEC-C motif